MTDAPTPPAALLAVVRGLSTPELLEDFWADEFPFAGLGEQLDAARAVLTELRARWDAGERFDPPPFVLDDVDEVIFHLARHLRQDPKGKKAALFQMHIGIGLQQAGSERGDALEKYVDAVRADEPGSVTGPLKRALKAELLGEAPAG
ncbi:hypothetical protein [Brevibacterium litoralis]|uniref:hypothetical protein n=1 Tax=Brevibacterium litoralis TaxID=3138935 RepID=UPI0032EF1914